MGNSNNNSTDWSSAAFAVFFLVIMYPTLSMLWTTAILNIRRQVAIKRLETKFKCRVITLIHRQESVGLLGLFAVRYISMEDAQSILDAIYLTAPHIPIYLIVHTPGGLVLASEQIARALNEHKAGAKMFVPYYAMSGGTLVGLGCKEIVMASHSSLGAVDPQIPYGFTSSLPASSIVKALEIPNPHREDRFLALGDYAQKALAQMRATVFELLKGKVDELRRKQLAETLSQGTWTHDYYITYDKARELGLPVSREFPIEIMRFMKLYKSPSSVRYSEKPYANIEKENQ